MTRARARRGCVALLIAAALPTFGCGDDEDLSLAPQDCVLSEPSTGPFHVKVTINEAHSSVPVRILLGDLEDGSFVLSDQAFSAITTYELVAEETYTATATYVIGADTVLVVDSGRISTSSEEFSNATCWSVRGGDADLRLRLSP